MSDALKHECGIALIRLLKPLEFYKEKLLHSETGELTPYFIKEFTPPIRLS